MRCERVPVRVRFRLGESACVRGGVSACAREWGVREGSSAWSQLWMLIGVKYDGVENDN